MLFCTRTKAPCYFFQFPHLSVHTDLLSLIFSWGRQRQWGFCFLAVSRRGSRPGRPEPVVSPGRVIPSSEGQQHLRTWHSPILSLRFLAKSCSLSLPEVQGVHLAAAGRQKVHLYGSFRVKSLGHPESLHGTGRSMPVAEAHASSTKEKKSAYIFQSSCFDLLV